MDWKLNLKTSGAKPKYRLLMELVAGAVASGRLKPGDRIPSAADLAGRLSFNKATVVRAFRELERQKLIVAQVGRGSFVAAPPAKNGEMAQPNGQTGEQAMLTRPEGVGLVRRMRDAHVSGVMELLKVDPPKPFINLWAGVPPETTIPRGLLERAVVRASRRHREVLYRYHHAGLPLLRERLAKWLGTRGHDLAPDQILITNGSQQAIGLLATWALGEQRTVVCETPTYIGTPRLLATVSANFMRSPPALTST
jgi:GntR family transcriptional regulator/MocR family aminotransferase